MKTLQSFSEPPSEDRATIPRNHYAVGDLNWIFIDAKRSNDDRP